MNNIAKIDWLLTAAVIILLILSPMAVQLYQYMQYIHNCGDILPTPVVPTEYQQYDGETIAGTKNNSIAENIIFLSATTTTAETEPKPAYDLTDEEKAMIAVVAWNADHTDDESIMCVVQTIINRTFRSAKFPGTVEKVLRQKKQFESCDKILYDKKQYDFDRVAKLIDKVCAGYDPFEGELVLFYSASRVKPSKIARGLTLVREVGGQRYYKQD